jgi:hypothetical protein
MLQVVSYPCDPKYLQEHLLESQMRLSARSSLETVCGLFENEAELALCKSQHESSIAALDDLVRVPLLLHKCPLARSKRNAQGMRMFSNFKRHREIGYPMQQKLLKLRF